MITQVRAKKSLGQHFLKDEGIARRIADSLELSERTPVLEIGPGMGVLTKYLINNPNADFTVVEIDKESVAYLNEHYPELRVIDGDFLKMRLDQVYPDGLCVIGNFPYNISSQIFFKVLEYRDLVPQVVGMIQKEVAERLAEPPGSRTYGILSVLLQAYYDIEYLFTVDENVFAPPPKVKSAVIRLKRNSRKSLDCDEKLFFTVVKTAFNQRRKQLRNSLKPLLPKKDDEAEPKILDYRPEQLGVEDFVELTNYVARRQADNPPDTIDVSDLAGKTLRPAMPAIPYLDADGVERQRYLYTVLTSADADVTYDEYGAENWYVVTNDVIVSGRLDFSGTAHLIVCDGATLAVTNATPNGTAIEAANLTIYGQANGTGNVTATGSFSGIRASGDLAINGGSVTANGGADGISATGLTINGGSVTAIGGDDGIVAHGYAVTINGGSVTANGGSFGIFADHAVTINGGTVTATCSIGGYGIFAHNDITLGWTNPTDSITASSYYAGSGSVRVKSGQRLTDGSAIYNDNLGPSPTALRGKTLRPYIYTPTYPAYLGLPADPADDTEGDAVIRANYDAWALRYGYDALGAYEAAFLLNVAPWATPIELRIAGIEVVEGGARVRVTCRAGASAEAGAVDLSQINGVISVSAGDDLGALAPKAVPAADVTYGNGAATVFVPASAGAFIRAQIGVSAPPPVGP